VKLPSRPSKRVPAAVAVAGCGAIVEADPALALFDHCDDHYTVTTSVNSLAALADHKADRGLTWQQQENRGLCMNSTCIRRLNERLGVKRVEETVTSRRLHPLCASRPSPSFNLNFPALQSNGTASDLASRITLKMQQG
jgi:hypothetical protein